MSKKKDGGPAFPVLSYDKAGSGDIRPQPTIFPGMSLRDYYIGQALHGLLADQAQTRLFISAAGWGDTPVMKATARLAVSYADATLAERGKGDE